jgi:hypothetical protein
MADTEAAQTTARIVAFESICEANMIILSRMADASDGPHTLLAAKPPRGKKTRSKLERF